MCVPDVIGVSSMLRLTRKTTALGRVFPTFTRISEDRTEWWKWKSPRFDYVRRTPEAEKTLKRRTVLLGELQYLKIETRLIDEMLASVMGEYVFLK